MIARAYSVTANYFAAPLASNAAQIGGMRLINVALGFVTTVILIRSLGAYAFGLFAFGVSVAAMFSIVTRLGLPLLIVREGTAARARNDWAAYHGVMQYSTRAGFVLVTVTATIILAVFAGPTPLADTEYATPGVVGVLGGCLMTINALLQARLRGAMEISRAYASEFLVMQGAMLLFIAALALLHSLTLERAFLAFLASWAMATAMSLYWWRGHKTNIPWTQPKSKPWKKLSGVTLSLFCLGLTMLFIGKIETLFLAAFAGPDAVANFALAFRVASVTSIAGFAISSLFGPRLSDLNARGADRVLLKEIRTATVVNAAASISIAVGVSLVGWVAIPVIAPELTTARYITPIIALGFVLASFTGRSFDLAAMFGSNNSGIMAAVLTLPVFIALLFALTPAYGLVGAASATAIATTLDVVLLCIIVYHQTGLRSDILSIRDG